MTGVDQRVEEYLHQGESVREAFDVGPFRAVLTTHRIFVVMPGGAIQQADLPDVTGVDRTTRGSTSGLVWGVSFLVIGVTLFALGVAASTSDLVQTPEFSREAAAEAGAGSLVELVEIAFWFIENLDTILLWVGALCVALAVLPTVNYWFRVRQPTLTIRLAGEQADIHLSREHVPVEDESRLEGALAPEQAPDDGLEQPPDGPEVAESNNSEPTDAVPDGPEVAESNGNEPTDAVPDGPEVAESNNSEPTDAVSDGADDDDAVRFEWVDTGMTDDRADSER